MVLVGSFTRVQKDIARRKTSVDVDKVLVALRWLKKHNILYRDLNIGEEHICMPKFVDLSSSVESQGSNVEKGFSYKVVFVDHKEPTHSKSCIVIDIMFSKSIAANPGYFIESSSKLIANLLSNSSMLSMFGT